MAKDEELGLTEAQIAPLRDLFAESEVMTKEHRAEYDKKRIEPQMRVLHRILGDVVLGIFPVGLIESVEKAYKHWEMHPDSFLVTHFDTAQDRDDSLAVMRAYCELAGENGYTVYTDRGHPDDVLAWRVQPRRGSKPKG